jgi:hypothetical protein
MQHFCLQADGEAEGSCCFSETVDDVLQGLLRMGDKGAVICEEQLHDQLL